MGKIRKTIIATILASAAGLYCFSGSSDNEKIEKQEVIKFNNFSEFVYREKTNGNNIMLHDNLANPLDLKFKAAYTNKNNIYAVVLYKGKEFTLKAKDGVVYIHEPKDIIKREIGNIYKTFTELERKSAVGEKSIEDKVVDYQPDVTQWQKGN